MTTRLIKATLGLALFVFIGAVIGPGLALGAEEIVTLRQAIKSAKEPSLPLGEKIYRHYCTPCHGLEGNGKGFNAPNLLIQPANHTDAKFMSERTDQKLIDTVDLGGVEVAKSTLMPPWGAVLGDIGIKSVVLKLRALCQCQSARSW